MSIRTRLINYRDGDLVFEGMLAWDDPLATPEQAVALGQELASMGADWQLHCYGNVRHAFTNPAADASTGVTVYNEAADRRSWAAAQYFLSELFDN